MFLMDLMVAGILKDGSLVKTQFGEDDEHISTQKKTIQSCTAYMIPDGRNRRWDDFDVLKYVNGHKQNFKRRLNNETLARRSHSSTRLLLLLQKLINNS